MKRLVALALSTLLALSVSPAVHATERPVTNTVSAAPLATPFADEVARAAADRKKCTFMCVQSRLPKVEYAIYFVNDDSDLLMFDDDGIVLRDLDTKQDELTASYPSGVDGTTVRPALSADQTEVLFYADHSSGTGRVYRVSLGDLSVTLITTAIDNLDMERFLSLFVAPDHSGFYLLYRIAGGGDAFLCQYLADGTQQVCSDGITDTEGSPIFSNESGTRLYVMSSTDTRNEFDTTNDLAKTSTAISGLAGKNVNFEYGIQASNGNMFFLDYNTEADPTAIYKVPIVGANSTSLRFSANFDPIGLTVPRTIEDRIYVIGQAHDNRLLPKPYSTVLAIDGVVGDGAMKIKSSAKIKGHEGPRNVSVDSAGRYVLAYDYNVPTYVMPVGTNRSVWARTSTEYTYCPAQGWNVSWDYINLAPGKTLTHYSMMYKGPGARKWQVLETFPATGLRSVPVPRGVEAGGEIKVVPKGIKLRKVTTSQLVVVPPAPRPFDPQPGC